jgi:CheY-like chemotaxis protein
MTRILVVDDSAVDRAIVGELLGKEPDWKIELAENGAEALERLKTSPPDLVVTDIQMPKMDGLELVTAVREFHSGVPVILMTANGSEAVALEALERGAANYVPKSQMVHTLLASVKQVLSLARADRGHKRLFDCLTATEFTLSLENDLSLMEALVDLIQGIVGTVGLCDPAARLRVGMALEQALHNAVYWGNLEITLDELEEAREQMLFGRGFDLVERRRSEKPYCDRRVSVHAHICADESRFVVRDQGAGFDVSAIPQSNSPSDLEKDGRGLVLMRAFMDEVTYNDVGNEVTLVKRRG